MAGQLPSQPNRVVITTGNGQVYLFWQQVLGVTNYLVQRSLTGIVGSYTTVGSPTNYNYLDTTCSPGIQYWYQVASVNGAGTSSFATLSTNNSPLTITPCLPGQINLGYLRYMSKLKADMLKSGFLADDEWNFNLNQSANRLYDLLITKFGDNYFAAPRVQFNTTGAAIYTLPNGSNYGGAPALYKLIGVDCGINASNNEWFTLPRYNIIDRNKYSTLQLAGTTQSVYGLAYIIMGSNLEFIPLPTSAQTIQLLYVPMLTQMLQDPDMMPFSISGWSELVIVDAAIKALMKEESFDEAQFLIQERAGILERIEMTAANRDVGQPNSVSNTRARCGDQNFGGIFNGFSGWGAGGGSGWG